MKIDLGARTKNTFRNTAIGMISQMIQIVSSFACRMVFVRALATAYLGVNGLFSNVLSILSLGELGIGSAITYELYKALANGDDGNVKSLMNFYKKAYLIIGSAIGIVGIIIVPLIPRLVPADPMITEDIRLLYLFFLANTVISYLFSYRTSIIQAAQQNYILTLIHTIVTITQNVAQIIILLTTHNFVLYLTVQVTATLLYYVFSSVMAEKMFPILKEKEIPELPEEQKKRMFVNTKDLFITSLSTKLVNQTDNIIITALGGLVSTGLNSNYSLMQATLISITAKISDAIRVLFRYGIRNLPVVDENKKLVGIISNIDIVRSQIEKSRPSKVMSVKRFMEEQNGLRIKIVNMDVPMNQVLPSQKEVYMDELIGRQYEIKRGLYEPLIVIKRQTGYLVVDGHHRAMAAKKLGLDKFKAIVLEPNDLNVTIGLERTAEKWGLHTLDDVKIIEGSKHPFIEVTTMLLPDEEVENINRRLQECK